ncbi:hypothetical protein AAFF_G00160120 [Aldrovandia affinis]|uniref:Uncharacterized protein n=1 Tax=Aldrovandia affinis TaxID=143900 RepID=A0AAD7W7U9_9TELE|nr:hypothetical protein AAFF_G00160120 [Aldrovandia affinis]
MKVFYCLEHDSKYLFVHLPIFSDHIVFKRAVGSSGVSQQALGARSLGQDRLCSLTPLGGGKNNPLQRREPRGRGYEEALLRQAGPAKGA